MSRNGDYIMCKAAEVGKIVINKCKEYGLDINAQKLQKLLVLMQIDCIQEGRKPLFKEDIVVWSCGVAIKEVENEFKGLGGDNVPTQIEYINLLDQEKKSVDKILRLYGTLDAIELNVLPTIQKVISLAVQSDDISPPRVRYEILMGAFLEK